ncbi:MAG: hypothetical protein R3Y58_14015, partial [Eubacteriales bacterium]
MKKLLLLTLLSLTMGSLVACGSNTDDAETTAEIEIIGSTSTEETEEEVTEETDEAPEVIEATTEDASTSTADLTLIAITLSISNETELDLSELYFQPADSTDSADAQLFTGTIAIGSHSTMDYLLSSDALILDIIATDEDGNEIIFADVDFSKITSSGNGKDGVDEAQAELTLEVIEGDEDEEE